MQTFQWDTAKKKGVGMLRRATGTSGITWDFEYDSLARLVGRTLDVGGSQFETRFAYDSVGRAAGTTYPAVPGWGALQVQNMYTSDGFLSAIKDTNGLGVHWEATDTDVVGSASEWQAGPFAVKTRRDPSTGLVRHEQARYPGGQVVHELALEYWADDTTKSKTDRVLGITEDYKYDTLKRLTRWDVIQNCRLASREYGYDDFNNLLTIDDVVGANTARRETRTCGIGASPHQMKTRVDSVGNQFSYQYGAQGNQTYVYQYDQGSQTYTPITKRTFNAFGLPTDVTTNAGKVSTFEHDAFFGRVYSSTPDETEVQIPGMMSVRARGNRQAYRFYVSAPTGVFAEVEVTVDTSHSKHSKRVSFVLNDVLNSPAVLGEGSGHVTARPKFDPFGELAFSHSVTTTQRGTATDSNRAFTGHQNLIGIDRTLETPARWYPPGESRFLSPDLLEGGALPTQLNPYAYVLNRPSSLTDPTGLQYVDVGAPPGIEFFMRAPQPVAPHPRASSSAASAVGQKLRDTSLDVEVPETFTPLPNPDDQWAPWPGTAGTASVSSLPPAAAAPGAATQVSDGSFRGGGAYGSMPLGSALSQALYQTIALTVDTATQYISMMGLWSASTAPELAGTTYGGGGATPLAGGLSREILLEQAWVQHFNPEVFVWWSYEKKFEADVHLKRGIALKGDFAAEAILAYGVNRTGPFTADIGVVGASLGVEVAMKGKKGGYAALYGGRETITQYEGLSGVSTTHKEPIILVEGGSIRRWPARIRRDIKEKILDRI